MKSTRLGRAIGVLAVAAVVMVPMAIASAAFADDPGVQSTANVGTGDELIEQWAITNNTVITLTADISITTCEGDPFRDTGGSGIVIDGQGLYGISQTCDFTRVLRDEGQEHVTLRGLTHFEGGFACGAGGGLYTNGSATIENSTVNDNEATQQGICADAVESDPVGGGVFTASGPVNVVNSTFSHNHAELAGGGFAAQTGADVSGSQFNVNSAGVSGEPNGFDSFSGAGFATLGSATVSGSSFQGNFFGDAEGPCEDCGVLGGGFFADDGALVDGSTFSDNTANCDEDCDAAGGAIGAHDSSVGVTGSTFSENSANCNEDCDLFGGAIYSPSVTTAGSSYAGNFVGCDEDCDNEGGAIFSGDATVGDSTFTNNAASCPNGCAAFGGAITTVGFRDEPAPVAQSYGPDVSAFSNGWGGAEVSAAAFVQGAITIEASTFSGNTAVCDGGDCGASGGAVSSANFTSVTVASSTFDHNEATYAGGALAAFGDEDSAPVTITNSTVTQNTSGTSGAIDVDDAGATSLAYDTIVQNMIVEPPVLEHAEGDVAANVTADDVTLFGTIVALPIGGVNCDVDSPTSQGYNFSDDTSCGLDQATDKVATPNDPGLGALGANGGPTQTMVPQTGSPVIDAIPVAACQTGIGSGVTVDQRGVTRPNGPGCDIGAVEVEFVAPTPTPTPSPAVVITPKFTG